MTGYVSPNVLRLPTTQARDRLPEIIAHVQDPRRTCVLLRHGKPVAAVVSLEEVRRLHDIEDIEDVSKRGKYPMRMRFGYGDHATQQEAAEAVLKLQYDRLTEREVLRNAGHEPVPGGELVMEGFVPVPKGRLIQWINRGRNGRSPGEQVVAEVVAERKTWWRFWSRDVR